MRCCRIVASMLLVPAMYSSAQSTLVAGIADAQSGAPLEGAEVVLIDLHRIARANWMGEVVMKDIPHGDHHVRVRKLGYAAAEIDLPFRGDTVGPVFMLTPQALALDTVHVTAAAPVPLRLEPFEQRRRLGIGRFVSDSGLTKDRDRDLGWLVSTHFPGLSMTFDRDGTPGIQSARMTCTRMGCHPCRVRVMLDDHDLPGDAYDLVRPWDLAGMEYYSGASMPVQYRIARSDCGLLLLWSK